MVRIPHRLKLNACAAAFLLCVWLTPQAFAEVTVVAGANSTPVVAALQRELTAALLQLGTEIEDDVRVTIGVAALRKALAEDAAGPLVAAFVTSTEFEAAVGDRGPPSQATAVFSNPDPLDQLALVREILGRPAVGVFVSPTSHALSARLTEHGGDGVVAIPVAGQRTNALLHMVGGLDAIIVLPDTSVLNRSNINHVVRSLYQRRQVLIGYSDTLTKVGSLASVYPRRHATVRSVVESILTYARTGTMPPPTFVRDVDISVNERLARSLNIVIPEKEALLESLRQRAQEELSP